MELHRGYRFTIIDKHLGNSWNIIVSLGHELQMFEWWLYRHITDDHWNVNHQRLGFRSEGFTTKFINKRICMGFR